MRRFGALGHMRMLLLSRPEGIDNRRVDIQAQLRPLADSAHQKPAQEQRAPVLGWHAYIQDLIPRNTTLNQLAFVIRCPFKIGNERVIELPFREPVGR